jgi:5'-nucleotidase
MGRVEVSVEKILYVDLDNVLVDFQSALPYFSPEIVKSFEGRLDEVPGIFAKMTPVKGAVEAFTILADVFDIYILSTAPWNNPSAWSDKLEWVQANLGKPAYKRLILTHHKELNRGDFLVDDRPNNGAEEFAGELILFGSEQFPDWPAVRKYLLSKV